MKKSKPEAVAVMDTLEALLEAARRGSEEAFTELLRLHQARVRTFLSRFVRTRDLIDDLAQDTFLSAFRSLSSYRGEAPFGTWLLGIARHRALMHLRDEARRGRHEAVPLTSTVAGWAADRLEAGHANADHDRELAALAACVEALPENRARLIAEYYFKGRAGVDIARERDSSGSAVWVSLLRIRQALRLCVQGKLAARGADA